MGKKNRFPSPPPPPFPPSVEPGPRLIAVYVAGQFYPWCKFYFLIILQMIQTFYITISCENRKKERKFPTRIKLNHIGLPEGKGGNSFFSFFFWGGGGRGSGEWGGHHRSGWGGGLIFTLEQSTVTLTHSYYWSLIILHPLILWVCTICTIHLLMFSKKFVYI